MAGGGAKVASHGAFQGENPLDYALPLIILQICLVIVVTRGLAYLHEQCQERIVHCDVKPENILLDTAFRPKVADFGMAKLIGRDFSHALTTARGTVGYLAPEWVLGLPITPKADVYSYGMTLLARATSRSGRPPRSARGSLWRSWTRGWRGTRTWESWAGRAASRAGAFSRARR